MRVDAALVRGDEHVGADVGVAGAHAVAPEGVLHEPLEEGEVDDNDVPPLAGLPLVFDDSTGELKHFLADVQGSIATCADFENDARNFEKLGSRCAFSTST